MHTDYLSKKGDRKNIKRMVIITEISVVLLLMLLVLSGCGSRREKADEATTGQSTADAQPSPDTDEVPLSLDALQGH